MADRKRFAADTERYRRDPVAFVHEHFAAGWEDAHPGERFKLEEWHAEGFAALRAERDANGQLSIRVAAKAAKGVGKTFFLAMVALWILRCFPHAKGSACSVTGDNLETGLWTEIKVWLNYSPMLSLLVEHTKSEVRAKDHPETWKLSARTFAVDADPEKQNASMAGLHADHVFVLIDEAGAVPMGVFRSGEGIFTSKAITKIMVVVGNANDEDGPLGVIWSSEAHLWQMVEITGDPDDPKRCTRVDIEEARAQIALRGREDPVVRINILGLFPKKGSNKILSADEIQVAMNRDCEERLWINDPVIFGLDTAEMGDDLNVLTKRQGPIAWQKDEWTWRRLEPAALADRLGIVLSKHEGYGAFFIDVSFGWGEAIRLRLRDLGFPNIIGVDFAGEPLDPQYYNRRAEMHFLCADWIKRFGCITRNPMLRVELAAPGYKSAVKAGRTVIQVEPKKDIKARLGRSPDRSDSLILTHAAPVYKSTASAASHFRQTQDEQKFKANPYAYMSGKR